METELIDTKELLLQSIELKYEDGRPFEADLDVIGMLARRNYLLRNTGGKYSIIKGTDKKGIHPHKPEHYYDMEAIWFGERQLLLNGTRNCRIQVGDSFFYHNQIVKVERIYGRDNDLYMEIQHGITIHINHHEIR
jgi:hypothetical protein